MKKLNKLFIILLCCFGAMSATSCLNNDDNGGIDPELYQTYLTNISGTYYGDNSDWRYQNKIYFYNDTITGSTLSEKIDSIVGITISFSKYDSTFAITNVPGRVLAKEIPDEYKEMREAIDAAPMQTIKGKFIFYNISSYAYYMIYPETVTYEDLNYGGETHDVSIVFWSPVASGVYGYMDKKQVVNLSVYLASVYVDDKKVIDIYNGVDAGKEQAMSQLLFVGTR